LLANRFSDRLLEPLLQVQTLLTGKQEETPLQAPFPEVEPLLSSIQYLVRKLYHDLDEVTQTQQVRTDFVANASHELKSPLTSIKGFAELMASGLVASEGKRQEYLQRIVRESDRLLAIINDILHLSQAETTPPGPITTVDLQKIAQEVVQALEILAGQRRITLTVQGKAQAKANARDVWEMLYNLVDNGIRYGREGGVVRVMMQEGTQTVTLRVQDNGMGIRQEHLARIFERFYRVDPSRSRGSGGTGLGLSIVKHLAGKYQGAVEVESQPGEGATFTLRFLKA
ncbi:MAG: ATP-binding protein, partial [Clostridia bacterium]